MGLFMIIYRIEYPMQLHHKLKHQQRLRMHMISLSISLKVMRHQLVNKEACYLVDKGRE